MLIAQFSLSVSDWVGLIGLGAMIFGPIIGLLFRQTAQQAGTNARLDSMKESLDQRASEDTRLWDHVGRHEMRLNEHEVKLTQHDLALQK